MPATKSNDPSVLSSARWFWWIAGLSLVNTILFHSDTKMSFVVGLGLTTLANAVFVKEIAIAISALTIGFYAFVGFQAQRERLWAFYLGLTVYVFDALLFVKFEDWMPVAFHALVIFYIVRGMLKVRQLARAQV